MLMKFISSENIKYLWKYKVVAFRWRNHKYFYYFLCFSLLIWIVLSPSIGNTSVAVHKKIEVNHVTNNTLLILLWHGNPQNCLNSTENLSVENKESFQNVFRIFIRLWFYHHWTFRNPKLALTLAVKSLLDGLLLGCECIIFVLKSFHFPTQTDTHRQRHR